MTNDETVTMSREALKWAVQQLEEDGNKGCGYFDTLSTALAADVSLSDEGNKPAAPVVELQPLSVWEGAMPESNGKSNFTVILHTGDLTKGICVYRSEYPDRARYEADCFRHLIGDPAFSEKPFICDYDADKHSGYVKPDTPPPAPVAVELPFLFPHYRQEVVAAIEAAGGTVKPFAQPKVCECPPGVRNITDGGHFPACTACKRRLK